MKYKVVRDISKDKWSAFVENHPNGNIFQTTVMYEVYKQTKNQEPIFLSIEDDNGVLQGTMLAVIQKENSGLLGHFSARSIIIGGPLIKDDNLDVLDIILTEYKNRIRGRAIYSQFRNLWDWSNNEKDVFTKHGFDFESHLDILIDLKKSPEELWRDFSRDRKKSINKSQLFLHAKLINMETHFEQIYNLLKKVYDRIKLPLPDRTFFYNAMINLQQIDAIRVFGAFKETELVGVRVVLCYKTLIYDWYAGADDSYLEYRPNDILPWSVLMWGIDNKYSLFDFGGAGKPNVAYGVRDYKLKFGGNLVNFGRFEMIHKPIIFKIGKFGLFIYKKLHGLF